MILLSGKRDGSFIFNLRSIEDCGDLSTIPADKRLLAAAVRRALGVTQTPLSEDAIGARGRLDLPIIGRGVEGKTGTPP